MATRERGQKVFAVKCDAATVRKLKIMAVHKSTTMYELLVDMVAAEFAKTSPERRDQERTELGMTPDERNL